MDAYCREVLARRGVLPLGRRVHDGGWHERGRRAVWCRTTRVRVAVVGYVPARGRGWIVVDVQGPVEIPLVLGDLADRRFRRRVEANRGSDRNRDLRDAADDGAGERTARSRHIVY